jgi:hypothetical protein
MEPQIRDNKGRFMAGHNWWLGKKHPQETKDKIANSLYRYFKKHKNYWFGKKLYPSMLEAIYKAHKGIPSPLRGREVSEETKKKISLTLTGRKLSKKHIRNALKRRPISSLELRVQKVIEDNSLPYKFVGNGDFFIGRKNPDFVNINGEKIVVEVYARKHKEEFRGGVDKWQEERKRVFAEYGWKTIFIEDRETNKKETILELLEGGN